MTVQDAEAPRRHHEQPSAWEQNPDDQNGQLALLSSESRCNDDEEHRSEDDAQQHDDRGNQRQQSRDRAGNLTGFLAIATREQVRVYRDERRRKRALPEQILQEVRDSKRRIERVRCDTRSRAQVPRLQRFANDPEDSREEDPRRYECRSHSSRRRKSDFAVAGALRGHCSARGDGFRALGVHERLRVLACSGLHVVEQL